MRKQSRMDKVYLPSSATTRISPHDNLLAPPISNLTLTLRPDAEHNSFVAYVELTSDSRASDEEKERRIIDRCKLGEKWAFNELVGRYEARVFNFAFRLSGNRDDASDIAAEVFFRLYKSLHKFRGESTFTTWLYRIITNIYLDTRKRKTSHLVRSFSEFIDEEDPIYFNQLVDPKPLPSLLAEMNEQNALLHAAIGGLPVHQRELVVLFHLNHQSYDDIAIRLGIPLGTVKSRLNRARHVLRECLKSEREYFAA